MSGANTSRLGYLDGIRGWAALSVVIDHSYREMLHDLNPIGRDVNIIFLTDGRFAVVVFFVLSGFALSTGYFRGRQTDLVRHLALRRWIRLTIPIAAVTALAISLSEAGLFFNQGAADIVCYKTDWLRGQFVDARFSLDAVKYVLYKVYILTSSDQYGPFLWTMAWEMQGSFLVFGLILIVRPGRVDRFFWYITTLALFLNRNSNFACFIYGVIIADFEACGLALNIAQRNKFYGFVGPLLAIAVGAYRGFTNVLGPYGGILDMTTGALLIGSITISPGLKSLFQLRVSRYLGAISFPLYLSHAVVLCSLGSWLVLRLHNADVADYTLSLIVPTACILVSVALATLLWPIEALAISAARSFSRSLLSHGLITRLVAPPDHNADRCR